MKALHVFSIVACLGATAAFATAQKAPTVVTSNFSGHKQERKYDYALIFADGSMHCWGSWNTSDLKGLKTGTDGDRLIVKTKDGKLYAITDRNTIKGMKRAIEPMMKLAREQGALGRNQGELGKEQGKFGKEQVEVGKKQGELAREHAKRVYSSGTPKHETEKEREEHRKKMEELSKRMYELGKKQGEMGKKMGAMGKQMGELGRRMGEESRKADVAITNLIDDAFEKGLAKPVA